MALRRRRSPRRGATRHRGDEPVAGRIDRIRRRRLSSDSSGDQSSHAGEQVLLAEHLYLLFGFVVQGCSGAVEFRSSPGRASVETVVRSRRGPLPGGGVGVRGLCSLGGRGGGGAPAPGAPDPRAAPGALLLP